MKTINEQLADATAQIKALSTESEGAKAALSTLTTENGSLKAQLEAANKSVVEIETVRAELKAEKLISAGLTIKVADAEKENSTLKEEATKTEAKISAQVAERCAAQGLRITANLSEIKKETPGGVNTAPANNAAPANQLTGIAKTQAAIRAKLVSMNVASEGLSRQAAAR